MRPPRASLARRARGPVILVGTVAALVVAAGLVGRSERSPGETAEPSPMSAPSASVSVFAGDSAWAPLASDEPVRFEAADSGNTPPALLSLLEPGAAHPGDDRAPITLEVSPPAPPDTAPESPPVVEPPLIAVVPPGPPPVETPVAPSDAGPEPPAEAAVLSPPIVLRAAWFSYPEEARRRRAEGNVDVRILVDTGGGVAAVTIESGVADSTLNRAALDAARTMKFRPAHRGGTPVAVWFNYRFTFALPS